MIFQNSLKQVFRTPVRTSLFVVLLTAVTAFITIGINMHLSAVQSIALTDEAFTTIGTVSFKNLDNPDLTLNDIMDYDYSPIVNSNHVRLLDRRIMLAGVAQGVTTVYEGAPNALAKDGMMFAVIEFTPVQFSADGERTFVKVLRVLHSYHGGIQEGKVLRLEQLSSDGGGEEYQLELGKNYVTSGFEGYMGSSCTVFPGDSEAKLKRAGVIQEDDAFASIMETSEDFWGKEEGQLWGRLVEILQNSVKTLSVYTTNGLETMLIFQQGNALISSGRPFSQADYEEGAKVCIINAATAKFNGFQLGDKISLDFFQEEVAFFGVGAMMDSCVANANGESYEIIGLYTVIDNMDTPYGLYGDTIFVPQKSIPIQPDNIALIRGHGSIYSTGSPIDGSSAITAVYQPGWDNFVSFRLSNGSVNAFMKEMEQYDLSGLNFSFYDQGYSKISDALTGMQETAAVLTAICSAAGLGIALLFSLLFVGRQQRSIAIMYSLGAGRKKALAFLTLSVLLVVGLSVGIGSIAGYALSDTFLAAAYNHNIEAMAVDTSFSGVSGDDTAAGFQVAAPPCHQAPLAAAGSVLAVTLVFSGIFAARVLKAEPMQVLTTKEE